MHRLLLLALCFIFCGPVVASSPDSTRSTVGRGLSFEIYGGLANMNGLSCNQAVTFRIGDDHIYLSGRLYRAHYTLFENSWLAGYRFNPNGRLNATLSLGLNDAAYRLPNAPRRLEAVPSDYRKVYGVCGEAEVEFNFHIRNKPTPWGVAASYCYVINNWDNYAVASIGFKIHLLPLPVLRLETREGAKQGSIPKVSRREKRFGLNGTSEFIIPKNILRTRFGFSVLNGTHLEYERNLNDLIGLCFTLGVRYPSSNGVFLGFAETFGGPDVMLRGGEATIGGCIYVPVAKGWWSFGLRTGYRHRENPGFYAYSLGEYRSMSRVSDEILGLARFSYTWSTRSPIIIESYMNLGMRWAYQESVYPGFFPSYQHWLTRTPYSTKGWETLPTINVGFNIGIGW